MAGGLQDGIWPHPKFFFSVEIGGVGKMSFQEVSGLDTEAELIEYRAGSNKVRSQIKMPGMIKPGNVTMKKGVFVNDNKFWDWFKQIKLNVIERQTLTISLLDEAGSPTRVWKLANAWPTKITGTDLKAEGNEVAIETIEFAYERLTIENGDDATRTPSARTPAHD